MTSKYEYKEALGRLDKDTRVCILYLEKLIIDKFNEVLRAQQQPAPQVDLSRLELKDDSLQKQIDGLRPKVDAYNDLVKEQDERERYLKKLANNVEAVLDEMKRHFEELYRSGHWREGTRRKIREEGLLNEVR